MLGMTKYVSQFEAETTKVLAINLTLDWIICVTINLPLSAHSLKEWKGVTAC